MNFRKHLLLKRKVISSLIVFCIYAVIGIMYISIRSTQMDKEHIRLIESLDKIEVNFYNARIEIDKSIINNKNSTKEHINRIISRAHINIEQIHKSLLSKDCDDKLLFALKVEIDNLTKETGKNRLSNLNEIHKNFNNIFPKINKNIHKSIKSDNSRFKLEIFIFSCILILCLICAIIFILNLINKLITADRLIINNTIKIEEEERNRIAMDLHDDLGAQLSSISLYTKLLEREYANNDKISEKIKHIKTLSKQALNSAQIVISNLKPEHISKHYLLDALDKLIYRNNKLNQQIIEIDSLDFNTELEKTTEIILYRISTELLNNTLKHSKAKNIKIRISNNKNIVYYIYQDDGIGFNLDKYDNNKNMGLQNIKKRVDMLGGICKFESEKHKGMQFSLEFNRFKK